MIEFKGKVYDATNGSPFDRGSADSYYFRGAKPHYYPEGTYKGEIVTEERLTVDQLEAYYAGYEYNELSGCHKDYE